MEKKMVDTKYAFSETFYSIQGEGRFTGFKTAWLRFFLCNLQCNGFGQLDPTNPESYFLPYQDVNPDDYERLEDLPVFERGCDSSYSWNKKFRDMQHKMTAADIAERILDHIPDRKFVKTHASWEDDVHLCFTGGEPMMRHAQLAQAEILKYYNDQFNYPRNVTIETNGTQKLTDEFRNHWLDEQARRTKLMFSVSPKLWSVAGEKAEKAIKPEIVRTYASVSNFGQLKFVINGTEESWNELEQVVDQFRDHGVYWPIFVMPIGATVEGQEGELSGHMGQAAIADEALKRGYNVSARVHAWIWGNKIGT